MKEVIFLGIKNERIVEESLNVYIQLIVVYIIIDTKRLKKVLMHFLISLLAIYEKCETKSDLNSLNNY